MKKHAKASRRKERVSQAERAFLGYADGVNAARKALTPASPTLPTPLPSPANTLTKRETAPQSTFHTRGYVSHPGYMALFYSSFVLLLLGWIRLMFVSLLFTAWFIWQERRYELPVDFLRQLPFPLRPPQRKLELLRAVQEERNASPDPPELQQRLEAQKKAVARRQAFHNKIFGVCLLVAVAACYFQFEAADQAARESVHFAQEQIQKLNQIRRQDFHKLRKHHADVWGGIGRAH